MTDHRRENAISNYTDTHLPTLDFFSALYTKWGVWDGVQSGFWNDSATLLAATIDTLLDALKGGFDHGQCFFVVGHEAERELLLEVSGFFSELRPPSRTRRPVAGPSSESNVPYKPSYRLFSFEFVLSTPGSYLELPLQSPRSGVTDPTF